MHNYLKRNGYRRKTGRDRYESYFALELVACAFFACAYVLQAEEPASAHPNASSAAGAPLSSTLRLFVRAFRFEGNTVFSSNELAKLTAPYVNREISSEELEEARRAVTLHYVNH